MVQRGLGVGGSGAHGVPAGRVTRGLLVLALGAGLLAGGAACTSKSTSLGTLGKLDVSVVPEGEVTTDIKLLGAAQIQHMPGQTVVFEWRWLVDGADSGITTRDLDPSNTVKHQLWQLYAIANVDGEPSDRVYSNEVLIINSPPEIGGVLVQPPLLPQQKHCEDVNAFVSPFPSDADGDPVALTYEWRVNGTAVGTMTTLDESFFAANDVVTVTVSGDDGEAVTTLTSPPVTMMDCSSMPAGSGLVTGGSPSSAFFSGAGTSSGGSSGVEAKVLAPDLSADAPNAPVTTRDDTSDAPTAPLSVTESNVCSIGADGSLLCTGSDAFGLDQPPAGAFAQVAVETDYACAIRADDATIACWGAPAEDLGQLAPPEGAFSSIDLGLAAACGLRTTGEVACWGDPSLGLSPAPEGPFTHVDVSDSDACAIRAGGEVVCWGGAE